MANVIDDTVNSNSSRNDRINRTTRAQFQFQAIQNHRNPKKRKRYPQDLHRISNGCLSLQRSPTKVVAVNKFFVLKHIHIFVRIFFLQEYDVNNFVRNVSAITMKFSTYTQQSNICICIASLTNRWTNICFSTIRKCM